jgi:hypothetical protein
VNVATESQENLGRLSKIPTVVIGSNGMLYGPFENGTEASAWAARKWPDQQQIGDADDGWDITALWPPD